MLNDALQSIATATRTRAEYGIEDIADIAEADDTELEVDYSEVFEAEAARNEAVAIWNRRRLWLLKDDNALNYYRNQVPSASASGRPVRGTASVPGTAGSNAFLWGQSNALLGRIAKAAEDLAGDFQFISGAVQRIETRINVTHPHGKSAVDP